MNSSEVEKELLRRIKMTRDSVCSRIVEKTTKDAQRNFNQFEVNASTDNPRVSVSHSLIASSGDVTSSTVQCYGEQVIFIEFGVGVNNSVPKLAGKFDPRTSYLGDKSAFGFAEQGSVETAERPSGVVPLGHYGKGLGNEDVWIRPSALGIPNEYAGESHVHKKDGSVRTDVVWTVGHNPARALYRAYTNAVRYVLSETNRLSRTKAKKYTQLSLFD